MRKVFVAALLLAAASAFADAVSDVRNAEIAFAKAFADRDAAKFFSFVADDATFLSARRTLNGKAEIVKRWSEFFKSKDAPFNWRPERVVVANGGNLGLSTGPVFDGEGVQVGIYSSIWEKQVDGTFKIKFDGPGAPAPVDEGFITTPDGVKLHYRKTGSGPTIIVPLEFLLWDEMSKLADRATVIAYDLRSRGRSTKTEAISIQNDVKDLETVRKYFNVDRFTPVGFSYLGMMVALYAREHPERIEKLVQVAPLAMTSAERAATPAGDGSPPKELVERRDSMLKSGAIDSDPRAFCEVDAKVFAYALVGNPSRADRIPVHCELENEWPKNVWHTFKLLQSGEPLALTAKDFANVTAPVLVIHGTADRTAGYAGGVTWSKSWPTAKLVTVEGAAHGVLFEEPETVLAAIRKFLD
jgi:pimeloyl-ACP methyl ester carboxylesterase/ketosteroid isomerase-like protein